MAGTDHQLADVETKILSHFEESERQQSSTQTVADETGVARHTASKYLSVLEAKGLVSHDKVGNAKVWYPINEEITLRTITEDDIQSVISIAREIPEIDSGEDGGLSNFGDELRSHLETDNEFRVCAEADEKVIGFIVGDQRSWEFGSANRVGWIRILGVHPDYQGKQVGKMLGEEILRRFADAGVTSVRTIIDWDHSGLLPYFHSLGFDMQESTVLEKSIASNQKTDE